MLKKTYAIAMIAFYEYHSSSVLATVKQPLDGRGSHRIGSHNVFNFMLFSLSLDWVYY